MTKILIYLAICTIGMSGLYFTAYDLLVKRHNLVTLPDGHGFYVKNDELTQEMLDIVPVGMNIHVYGTIQVRESLTGKGMKNSTITVHQDSHFEHPMTGGDGK